ncbi:MAG: phosphatidylglycerophosphatase A [Planctomycetes bacterium]|nr:phosphatidylglycerophosphatase A [Planctomycetota bacterium]
MSTAGERRRPRPHGLWEWSRAAAATACFFGYSPYFPGTCGTLAAFLLYLPARGLEARALALLCGAVALLATAGCIALGRWAEGFFGVKDPPSFVLDEVAGFFVAVAGIEPRWGLGGAVAAFVAFRFFDMAKPLGIARLQRLPAGWGIAVDDLAAGVCANVAVRLAAWAWGA